MAMFSVNDDGKFELSEESKWLRENSRFRKLNEGEIRLISETSKKDERADLGWVRDACETYFELKEYFRAWTGVDVYAEAYEITRGGKEFVHSLSVYADGARAIDINAHSVIAECINKSSDFQISNGKVWSFQGLRLMFERSNETEERRFVDEDLFDQSVDDFDKMQFFEAFSEIDEIFPGLDEFFEEGSLFCAVERAVREWCQANNRMLPSPYAKAIRSLCKVISFVAVGEIDCPPELNVLCNTGGIRINLKCVDVDTIDVRPVLSSVLNFVSNIHLEWGIEDHNREVTKKDFDEREYYNDYDISFDIPVRWQYDN